MDKGLTICIASYQYDVAPLLQDFATAISLCPADIPIFLLVGDDASGDPFSPSLDALALGYPNLSILRPQKNLGRVGIRNLLASEVLTPWLLFIDADSRLTSASFIVSYLNAISPAVDVLAGGTAYAPFQKPPLLREIYGKAREVAPATLRAKAPYSRLALNNLLIRKETFDRAGGLDAAITGYGHEDTLLGKQLERIHASIQHVDNPVIHAGLEADAHFILKSKEAARGLARLYHQGKLSPSDAKLIRVGILALSLPISGLLRFLAALLPKKNLLGLDLIKLAAFRQELARLRSAPRPSPPSASSA
jgi:GT2 family glycosyltransferase